MTNKMWKNYIEKFSMSLGTEFEDPPFSSNEELKTTIETFVNSGLDKYDMFKDILRSLIKVERYSMDYLLDDGFIALFDYFEINFQDSYIDLINMQINEEDYFEDYSRSCEITSAIIDIFWSKMSVELQQQIKDKTDHISMEGLEVEWYLDYKHKQDFTKMFWTHLKFSSKILNPWYGTEKCRCEMFRCNPCRERLQKKRKEEENYRKQHEDEKEYDNKSYLAYMQKTENC